MWVSVVSFIVASHNTKLTKLSMTTHSFDVAKKFPKNMLQSK